MSYLGQIVYVLLFLTSPFILNYFHVKWIWNKSERIRHSLPYDKSVVFREVRVWFSGYNYMSLQNAFRSFNPTLLKYEFNIADLLFTNNALIVAGKRKIHSDMSGRQIHVIPLVIPNIDTKGLKEDISQIDLIRIELIGEDLWINFKDHQYLTSLKLVIPKAEKGIKEAIQEWRASSR